MRCLIFYINALLFLLTSCLGNLDDTVMSENDVVKAGQQVPSFVISISDGTTFNSSQMGRKPVCIVFFNTSCSDCRKELPIVQQIYEEFSDSIQFVCISRAEDKKSIQSFWTQNKLTLPYSAQTDRKIYNLFALSSIPRLYIIDTLGTIKNAYTTNVSEKELRKALKQLIQQ